MRQIIKSLVILPFLATVLFVLASLQYFYVQAKRWLRDIGGKMRRKIG